MRTVLRLAVTIAAAIVVVLLWPRPLGGATSFIVVDGPSMQPVYETGDLVVVRRAATFEVGDVIAFRTERGNVIHRIVGGDAASGFLTQGDNREALDPWAPRPDAIIGRAVAHVPAGGAVLAPIATSPLTAPVLGLALVGASGRRRRRRRRARRDIDDSPPRPDTSQEAPVTTRTRSARTLRAVALVTAAVLGLAALAIVPIAVRAWTTPSVTSVDVTGDDAVHRLSTEVVATGTPGTLYPSGRIGPIRATAPAPADDGAGVDGTAEVTAPVPPDAPTIFRAPLERLRLDVSHAVEPSADVTADLAVRVELVATSGFRRDVTDVVAPVAEADGGVHVTLDLADTDAVVREVNAEAGTEGLDYDIVVTPTAVLEGTIGGRDVGVERFVGGPVVLAVGGPIVALGGSLETAVADVVEARRQVLGTVTVLDEEVQVGTARVAATGTVLGLLAVAAAVLWFTFARDPHDRYALLYSSHIVDVSPGATQPGHAVRVASMAELVRIARRDQRTILHHRLGDGAHRYALPDGDLVYEYVVAERGASVASSAVADELPDDLSTLVGPDTPASGTDRVVDVASYDEIVRAWLAFPDGGELERVVLADEDRVRVTLRRGDVTFVHEEELPADGDRPWSAHTATATATATASRTGSPGEDQAADDVARGR